jgi:predicted ester cyclase
MARMVNGKAVEEWDYVDRLGLMQQLGVAPPMGKA